MFLCRNEIYIRREFQLSTLGSSYKKINDILPGKPGGGVLRVLFQDS